MIGNRHVVQQFHRKGDKNDSLCKIRRLFGLTNLTDFVSTLG